MLLVLDDDSGIPIPIDDCLREAWVVQYGRAAAQDAIAVFYERLAVCFAQSLAECLDADLKPPTEAQVRYAADISRQLGVALPVEALRFRGPMSEFIGRFAETYRHRWRHAAAEPPTET